MFTCSGSFVWIYSWSLEMLRMPHNRKKAFLMKINEDNEEDLVGSYIRHCASLYGAKIADVCKYLIFAI